MTPRERLEKLATKTATPEMTRNWSPEPLLGETSTPFMTQNITVACLPPTGNSPKAKFLKGFHFKFPHVVTDLKELSRKIRIHKAKKPAASKILAGSKSVQVETGTKKSEYMHLQQIPPTWQPPKSRCRDEAEQLNL